MDYGRLGEMRALFQPTVHVMALTATATRLSREKIIHSLHMTSPVVVNISPHKKNVIFTVQPKPDLDKFVQSIVSDLRHLRVNMPRTIIFCRRYIECAEMYCTFQKLLVNDFTEPPNAPNVVKYRLVDMYTKCTETKIKEDIISAFSKPEGTLRIIIGTIAFGMGIDCPDVRQIFHWGASNDIESYIQETGRSGRDGFTSNAVLFFSKADERFMSPRMVDYCKDHKLCRRAMLFSDFDGCIVEKPCSFCLCCDICGHNCSCRASELSECLVTYAFSHVAQL